MKNALNCVIITLIIIQKGSRAVPDDDFRPTPIPLEKWHDKRDGRLGTLQEIVKTTTSASVAVVPAHYWEDALRHSVYLTLVRDKIDQLIAKSSIKSENTKSVPASKEDDERDMWEKIKSAPFDRLVPVATTLIGDISVLARGRLIERNGGYRFEEDETTREKCGDEKCKSGVKAFWSVKRVRQTDAETHPGKYHYELTFSITSQTLHKEKKPHNNPVRTFTVRESAQREPEQTDDTIRYGHRPQRAVWVHKNIVPPKYHDNHHRSTGLDRFFSSLFSDEDAYDLPKYKPQNNFMQAQFPQLTKVGNVGSFGDQRKFMPYPYKPQIYKYSRHSLPTQSPPIIQPYIDFEGMFNKPYSSPHDHKNMASNMIKTTRAAFLPTPVMPMSSSNKINLSTVLITFSNKTETITKEPPFAITYKNYNKPKPAPVKVSYFADNVRPPVFNAPPGVFVTMDKKPFKPMPPLKFLHSSKSKPVDFRPSPQVLDTHQSDPDSVFDTAFRPITLGYTDKTTEKSDITETIRKRKLSTSNKKFAKTEENNKSRKTTTTAPDIITAHSVSFVEDDSTEWANLLGAFSKTTPIVIHKIKPNTTENVVPFSTTPVSTTTAISTTIAMKSEPVFTTTTPVPTKRTRPPHKFTKPNKIRKHKRVTTSTTTKSTEVPLNITEETTPTQGLIPLASSTATNDEIGKPNNNTLTTTPLITVVNSTMTTTVQPTTTRKPITTTKPSTTTLALSSTTVTSIIKTTTEVELPATTQPKNKNRYRQSTLMLKGTSVKHDRWSGSTTEKNKSTFAYKPSRRIESNFQGYSSTTIKTEHIEQNRDHIEHVSTLVPKTNTINDNKTPEMESMSSTIQSEYENSADQYASSSIGPVVSIQEVESVKEKVLNVNSEHDITDQNEYIFNLTATSVEKSNDIDDNLITTEQIITSSPQREAKHKGRCKKKKNNTTSTVVTKPNSELQNEVTTINYTTTENSLSSGFFDKLLRSFNSETIAETQPKPKTDTKFNEEIESFERIANNDNDFEDYHSSLTDKHKDDIEKNEYSYEENDDVNDTSLEHSPFNNDEDNLAARVSSDEYNDYQDHPYTLFELMAME